MRDDDQNHDRPAASHTPDQTDDATSPEAPTSRERPGRHRLLTRGRGPVRSRRTTVAVASVVACALGLTAVVELRSTDDHRPANRAVADIELRERAEQERASRALARTPVTPTTSPTPTPTATKSPAAKKSVAPTKKATPRKPTTVAPVAGLTAAQMNNATAIVRTGQSMGVPRRALVIAVATAMQESNLYNLASGALPESQNLPNQGIGWDHDSVGLFQQRASMGWGTVAQLMDPAYATRKFLTTLLAVPGWQQMGLAQAAQAVQVSAFPDAYAQHESRATVIVDAILNASV